MPRYIVERTFPDGLEMPANDDGAQIRLNIIGANTQEHVTWIHSFVSIDRKKTFCVYEGPTPEAVRLAASQNNLLRAHGLLMASRENYDDAKAIVLRSAPI